jgi:prepilin-type N-terminal cleavage/methylation domain-containing protein
MKVINNKKGFTLIELLVVVAIIGILSAVGVVAYNGYTAGAKESACKGNFRTMVKAAYENIMWCELYPKIHFKWNAEQSWEFDCDTMTYLGGMKLSDLHGTTVKEQIVYMTGKTIGYTDTLNAAALVEGRNIATGTRTTLATMYNPYMPKGSTWGYNAITLEAYETLPQYLGKISVIKKDSSGKELYIHEDAPMYLVTKCGDNIIEHKLDIY